MHKKLCENKIVNAENQSQVIEILRLIAEMVVYGDSKSELLFEYVFACLFQIIAIHVYIDI